MLAEIGWLGQFAGNSGASITHDRAGKCTQRGQGKVREANGRQAEWTCFDLTNDSQEDRQCSQCIRNLSSRTGMLFSPAPPTCPQKSILAKCSCTCSSSFAVVLLVHGTHRILHTEDIAPRHDAMA